MEGEPWNDLPLTSLFMPTAHKNSSPALQGQNSGTNDLIKQISWLTATKKTKMQWNDAKFERGCKPNRLSKLGLLFFFFLMCVYPTASELKPWAWQPSLTIFIYEATRMRYFPHLSAAHFSKCDYAALWMPLLGTFCRPAFATGLLPTQHNRGGLLSLTPALRNVLNYPKLSPSSKLSTLSDFAQMFKEKVLFCFVFALNECQEHGTILYKEMHKSALSKSWLWAHFLLFPASPHPKK